jgi:hypothetical protein
MAPSMTANNTRPANSADPDTQGRMSGCHPASDHLSTRTAAILVALFFLFSLPAISTFAEYHGDERFYTDAAIEMLTSGDLLTPRYADGSLRYEKPLLSYWMLAASYASLGFSAFSSRFPFLLCGCLAIWLSFALARTLFRRGDAAVLATALMVSNLSLTAMSRRSTGDVVLCAFCALSLLGFARILFSSDLRRRNYLAAYVGCGLAVATKGLPGILPVVFAFAFCIIEPSRRRSLRLLLDVPAMLAGLAVGIFWVPLVLALHGEKVFAAFFSDQVGSRVAGSPWKLLQNAGDYAFAPIRHFLPWTALLVIPLIRDRRRLGDAVVEILPQSLFVLIWTALLIALFLGGNLTRARYLLPAYPLIAAWLGFLLAVALREGTTAEVVNQWAWRLTKWIGFGAASGLALFGFLFATRLLVAALLLLALTLVLLLAARRGQTFGSALLALALVLAGFYSANDWAIRASFAPTPAEPLAADLAHLVPAGSVVGLVDVEDFRRAQMQILLGGRIHFEVVAPDSQHAATPPTWIGPERTVRDKAPAGAIHEPCRIEYGRWSVGDVWALLTGGKPGHVKRYCLVLGEAHS